MGGMIEKIMFKKGIDRFKKSEIASQLWKIPVVDIDGRTSELSKFTENKKAFIFVNVACK
jgi:hypothetical protein